jgi:hypothetical protein
MIVLNTTNNSSLCIFNKNNYLYIKNSLGSIQKISNSVYLYSSIIDKLDIIHICYIDLKGFFNYCTYEKNNINFVSTFKLNAYVKKISNLSLYISNNSLNIFFATYLDNNLYNICHMNYDLHTYEYLDYIIKNVYKSNNQIYKINISNNYIICSYNSSKGSTNYKSMAFNLINKSWLDFSSINPSTTLFDYCDSIKYE